MIYAVSLNPCIDKTARIPRFDLDAPNRMETERADVGGKGVNVARVIRALGGDGMLIGFDYDQGPVAAAMEKERVPYRLTALPGALRTNIKLRETETGRTIEISERGPAASPEALNAVKEALLSSLKPGDWVSLSGSLPPGAPAETYADLCRAVQEKGGFTAVDCDGPALKAALEAHPSLIKPNAQEFKALTGIDPRNEAETLRACEALLGKGIGMICLSRGGEGAMIVNAGGAWSCSAAKITPQGTQGAGDSLLAALMLALSRGMEPGEALRFATAAAGASVMRPGTLLCRREDAEALMADLPASVRIR